jgi:hypothetical protein
MTMPKTKQSNPFYSGTTTIGGKETYYFCMTAEDRISRVKTFTRAECLAALRLQDLQKSVFVAVNRRLKELERANA